MFTGEAILKLFAFRLVRLDCECLVPLKCLRYIFWYELSRAYVNR